MFLIAAITPAIAQQPSDGVSRQAPEARDADYGSWRARALSSDGAASRRPARAFLDPAALPDDEVPPRRFLDRA
jgi:hypothetical protein